MRLFFFPVICAMLFNARIILAADTPQAGVANEEDATVKLKEKNSPSDSRSRDVTVNVDWNKPLFKTTRDQFSLALFQGTNARVNQSEGYRRGLKYMNPGTVRIHAAPMMKDWRRSPQGWLDIPNQKWATDKIIRAVESWDYGDAEIVLNIPDWPPWMDLDGDRFLDEDKFDDFADFCAELVRIVNVQSNAGVKYWEITNERDGLYWVDFKKNGKPDRLPELAEIYNRAALKMKDVDGSIKTGGPAVMRSDFVEDLRRFVRATKANMDFLSFHMYASGSTNESDEKIFRKTQMIGENAARIVSMLQEESPDRHIESHLNEYNISWTWKTREPRMTNEKGAIFDALTLIEIAAARVDVGNAWNERDGIYGKMDADHNLRPGAHVFHLFNTRMVGTAFDVVTDSPIAIQSLAVTSGSGGKSLVLINQTDLDRSANILAGDFLLSERSTLRINSTGLVESQYSSKDGPLALPQHSVTFIF